MGLTGFTLGFTGSAQDSQVFTGLAWPTGPGAAHAPHAGSVENARKVGFPSFEHRRARRSSLCVQRDAQNSISRDYLYQHTTGTSKVTPAEDFPTAKPRPTGATSSHARTQLRLTPRLPERVCQREGVETVS